MKIEETESVHYGGDTGWKVYIHDARDRPTLGVSTHGTSLYHGQGRDLRLDIKKVRKYHTIMLAADMHDKLQDHLDVLKGRSCCSETTGSIFGFTGNVLHIDEKDLVVSKMQDRVLTL